MSSPVRVWKHQTGYVTRDVTGYVCFVELWDTAAGSEWLVWQMYDGMYPSLLIGETNCYPCAMALCDTSDDIGLCTRHLQAEPC